MNVPTLNAIQRAHGAITIEYLIISILLMLPIWYFVVGGSGNWRDSDHQPNAGNLTRTPLASEVSSQSAIRVLHDRQHSFADSINQP